MKTMGCSLTSNSLPSSSLFPSLPHTHTHHTLTHSHTQSQVVYQNILKLAYVDKLLDQVHLVFRDRYKNEVVGGAYGTQMDFSQEFKVCVLHIQMHAHSICHTYTHIRVYSGGGGLLPPPPMKVFAPPQELVELTY